jgi:hypothetical protein
MHVMQCDESQQQLSFRATLHVSNLKLCVTLQTHDNSESYIYCCSLLNLLATVYPISRAAQHCLRLWRYQQCGYGGTGVARQVVLQHVPLQLAERPAEHAAPSGRGDSSHLPADQQQYQQQQLGVWSSNDP